jgi:hypothetical protein
MRAAAATTLFAAVGATNLLHAVGSAARSDAMAPAHHGTHGALPSCSNTVRASAKSTSPSLSQSAIPAPGA